MIRLFEFADVPEKKSIAMPIAPASDQLYCLESDHDLGKSPIDVVELTDAHRVVMLSDPRSPGADRFRFLRMRLRELRSKKQLKSLVITSPIPQDGKSTVALNLATALSEGGNRSVLLVEGDLHCPSIAKRLGVTVQPGLAECLENGLDPFATIRKLQPLNFYLIQAGTPKGNPTELLQSGPVASILDRLSHHFDWILIDTPPLAPLTDALSFANLADGCLLVMRAGHTPRETMEEALAQVPPGRVVGIVFNGAEGLQRMYAKYSNYYGRK